MSLHFLYCIIIAANDDDTIHLSTYIDDKLLNNSVTNT